MAVGRFEITRRAAYLPVGSHENRLARLARRRVAVDRVGHVPDIGGAIGAGDHVVAIAQRHRGQVGVHDHAAVRLHPAELLGRHCDDQEAPVGKPAESRGVVVFDRRDHFGISVDGRTHDPVPVHVREPERAVAPARTLYEVEAGKDRLRARQLSHCKSPAHPRAGGATARPAWDGYCFARSSALAVIKLGASR